MKEYIVCSAIHFDDGLEHKHQPINIKTGFVVFGLRHNNCYATLGAIATSIGLESRIRLMIHKADRDKQGFLTSANRYVSREEAFIIAKKNKQIFHTMFDKDETGKLNSEDIFGYIDTTEYSLGGE